MAVWHVGIVEAENETGVLIMNFGSAAIAFTTIRGNKANTIGSGAEPSVGPL